MRVLSWNIWNYSGHWLCRRHRLVELIREAKPDLIALQEVRFGPMDLPRMNQAAWLARALDLQCTFQRADILFPLPLVVEGLAFLSSHPLTHAWTARVSNFRGAGPKRIVLAASMGECDVYNVHLPLLEKARLGEAQLLVNLVRGRDRPAILVGDFNSRPNDPPMQALSQGGLIDIWSAQGAADGRESPWPHGDRIDYALSYHLAAPALLTPIPVEGIEECRPSDHPGMIVDVDL